LRRLPFKIHLGFGVGPTQRTKAIAPYKNSRFTLLRATGSYPPRQPRLLR